MEIYFTAGPAPRAQAALPKFIELYGQTKSPAESDVIVSLGGDGQTLLALLDGIKFKKKVFGINFGYEGHLQNLHKEAEGFEGLDERIKTAEVFELSPLLVKAELLNGDIKTDFAINESQVCTNDPGEVIFVRFFIDGIERVSRLGGDGLIIATTTGSTALSESAGGPMLPLRDDLLTFTPRLALKRGRLSPSVISASPIRIEVIDPHLREARALADSRTLGCPVLGVDMNLDPSNKYKLLFDRGHGLQEKVMRRQFSEPSLT